MKNEGPCFQPSFRWGVSLQSMAVVIAVLGSGIYGVKHAEGMSYSTYYGDDDGFGVGATVGVMNPDVSHATVGEAPFTDIRLIADESPFIAPAFKPSGSFTQFALGPGEVITSAMLTMRAGGLDVGADAIDGPSKILLDGVEVANFLNLFTANGLDGNAIELVSVPLTAQFFPLLRDGLVSLNGSHISENFSSGSFQIDFLGLNITTTPEPSTLALTVLALVALPTRRRKSVPHNRG